MKPATDALKSGQSVETVTRQRIIPTDASKERSTPELWQYLESLDAKGEEEWDRHIIYIYRIDPTPSVPVEKCGRYMAVGDGSQVSLADKEEVEFALAKKYGGRIFRLIVKRGSERVTQDRVYVDAPPKPIVPPDFSNGNSPMVLPLTESSAMADVSKRAMETIAGQEHQAIAIATNALSATATMVQRLAQQPQSQGDDITRQFMAAAMARLLAPPPDPLQQLSALLALVREMNGGGGGAGNPVLNKVLDTAVEKLLNPSPSGPVSSAGAELVRTLPSVASHVTDGLREWRLGMEAQRDAAATMRGVPGRPPAPPGTLLTSPQPNPAPVEGQVAAPSLEFIESKIVEIMKQPVSADEAALDALAFLDTMDARLVPQLTASGESGLITLFNTRPVLKPATANMPRLLEFIRAFLRLHAEHEADAGPSPSQVKPN